MGDFTQLVTRDLMYFFYFFKSVYLTFLSFFFCNTHVSLPYINLASVVSIALCTAKRANERATILTLHGPINTSKEPFILLPAAMRLCVIS